MILSARLGEEARRRALETLLATYWTPLYIYLRRRGQDSANAEDAVQGFFLHLLEGDEFLLRLDPARGRFRGYLKAGLDHFLANQYASAKALKRGGEVRVIRLDTALAERELLAAPDDPAAAYDREWALRVMERALDRLRAEYAEGRRQGNAEAMLRFFSLAEAPTYAEAYVSARG